jgi:hypothetical protein
MRTFESVGDNDVKGYSPESAAAHDAQPEHADVVQRLGRLAALAAFIGQSDAHLAEHPDDLTVRLTKVENVFQFGDSSAKASLAADLQILQAMLYDDSLPAAQRMRVLAAYHGERCTTSNYEAAQRVGCLIIDRGAAQPKDVLELPLGILCGSVS